jgi:hypothetical protein
LDYAMWQDGDQAKTVDCLPPADRRMNAVVEAYLRAYINWTQTDWARWTTTAQIAIKGRIAISTGVSPFFLQHGYNVDPVQEDEGWTSKQHNRKIPRPDEAAVAMIEKFKEVFNYVQARMAEAQQAQELQPNCHRQEPPILQVGDRVWLRHRCRESPMERSRPAEVIHSQVSRLCTVHLGN